MNELVDSMGYFQSSERGHRLHVAASIQATMHSGGTPVLAFHRRQQIRALLILEDAFAEALNWNPLAAELAAGMTRLGIPVTYGRFFGSPAQFKTPDGLTHRLEDLEDERHGHLLLLFTDGKSLQRSENRFVLEELTHWPLLAWLDLRDPRAWDENTALALRYSLPLYPATPVGVLAALRSFLSEQGPGRVYTTARQGWQGLPSQADARLDAYVEQLLGDALPWAQACALLQPCSPGLADALRRTFHPRLPPERIERLYDLPGTEENVSGLRFSVEVQRVLRAGFLARRADAEQEAVLRFLLTEIEKAEPGDETSIGHLAWEAVSERVRLDVDQDAALARLAQLAKTPLGPAISAGLENFGLPEEAATKIPLRKRPSNRHAWQRLARIADSFQTPKLEAYPVEWGHRLVLGTLVVVFLCFSAVSIRDLLSPPASYQNMEIEGSVATLNETYVQLNMKAGETWVPQKIGQVQLLNGLSLLTTGIYSLTVYGGGHKASMEITPKNDYKMIICVKALSEKEKCSKSLAQKPDGQEEESAEEKDKVKVSTECHIERSDIGLMVERCPDFPNNSNDVVKNIWLRKLGSNAPHERMMSIGFEVALGRSDSPVLRRIRNKLLESSSVDVIYRIYPDSYGKWYTDEIRQYIREDLGPLIQRSQLIWWATDATDDLFNPHPLFSGFDGILKLSDDEDLSWTSILEKILEHNSAELITEQTLIQALNKETPRELESQIVLLRLPKIQDPPIRVVAQITAGNAPATETAAAAATRDALLDLGATRIAKKNAAAATATSVWLTEDSDKDGLTNQQELTLDLQPNNFDTDGDGLSDGVEVNQYRTMPQDDDSDKDGRKDGAEVERGSNPLLQDTDGDGEPDNIDPDPVHLPTLTSTPTPLVIPTPTATDLPRTASTLMPILLPTTIPQPTPTATNLPQTMPTSTHQPLPTATPQPTPTVTDLPRTTSTSTHQPLPTATPQPTPTVTDLPRTTSTSTHQPLPTATPQPTATVTVLPQTVSTSTPQPRPTSTPQPPSTATPTPPARATIVAVVSAIPTFVNLSNRIVTKIQRDDGSLCGSTWQGRITIRWMVKGQIPLPKGYGYELVVWVPEKGEDPLLSPGLGATRETSGIYGYDQLLINPDLEHQIGVLLVQLSPYRRVMFIGPEGCRFRFA